uniref:Uncharacterized protein n=1 Tax=Lepeophtheirus salmonis TaxID=72036 RepID=A0A0K2SZJ6_LEPSM
MTVWYAIDTPSSSIAVNLFAGISSLLLLVKEDIFNQKYS